MGSSRPEDGKCEKGGHRKTLSKRLAMAALEIGCLRSAGDTDPLDGVRQRER